MKLRFQIAWMILISCAVHAEPTPIARAPNIVGGYVYLMGDPCLGGDWYQYISTDSDDRIFDMGCWRVRGNEIVGRSTTTDGGRRWPKKAFKPLPTK